MKALDVRLQQRIYALLSLFFLVVVGLMGGLYRRQVIDRDQSLTWAEKQQLQPIPLIPLRGKILDSRGALMAVGLEAGSLFAHPASVEDPVRTARLLASHLEVDARSLQARLAQPVSFVWLARQLPLRKAREVQAMGLSGIGMEKEGKRYYPNRELASNVIGFVGVDSQGLEGLELHYERDLRGAKGILLLQRDARGELLWREVAEDQKTGRGREIVLTLDLRIQFAAESALQKSIRDTGALSGSAVVLDPRSGEILAMACVPTFNPNRFNAFGPGQWRNRCITDTFEPGSTVKPFLLAAVMEEGLVTEQTTFDCEKGAYFFGGHVIHDIKPHGVLKALEVITHSSNIGATKMAERLQAGNWWQYLSAFGFGRETGVDLPGEESGALRPWKKWAKVDLATHGFGQGFSVTALQLTTAFAAIANGGFLIEPCVVREVRDESGQILEVRHPKVVRRVVSKETADRVLAVLEAVVESGTGKRGQVPGFRVGGKTGTAQQVDPATGRYSDERPVVSFVGLVPADRPELVIAVVLRGPEGDASGGMMAAPVFRDIAISSLHYRGVPGKEPESDVPEFALQPCSAEASFQGRLQAGQAGAAWIEPEEAWRMPDLRRLPLRTGLRVLQGLPFRIRVQGSGRIATQDPAPGDVLRPGQVLRLVGSTDGSPGLREPGAEEG